MRKHTAWLLAALTALLCTAFAGCAGGPAPSSSELPVSEPEETVPPLLNVDIAAFLTTDEVAAALGLPVNEALVLDEGTAVAYYSTDATAKVDVVMDQCTRDVYDLRLGLYEALTAAPNLGEDAKWNAATGELLVYSRGYMFSVAIERESMSEDARLLAARQLALRIIESLAVAVPSQP